MKKKPRPLCGDRPAKDAERRQQRRERAGLSATWRTLDTAPPPTAARVSDDVKRLDTIAATPRDLTPRLVKR